MPPRLHPLTKPLKIVCDYFNTSVKRNYPTYTHCFEPLVRSIQVADPEYPLEQTDIVTNASNLRKMFLVFVNRQREYERYDLTWRNNTLFLSKWTSDPHLSSSLGHGSGFEQATCLYDEHEHELLKSSTSHHRVTGYRFGGLQLVVQSEADAYHCDCHNLTLPETSLATTFDQMTLDQILTVQRRLRADSSGQTSIRSSRGSTVPSLDFDDIHSTKDTTPIPSPTAPAHSSPFTIETDPKPKPTFTSDDGLSDLAKKRLSMPSSYSMSSFSSPTLEVLHLGRDIPASCLVEVKTHKVNNKPLFNAEAQLYFAQVNKLYLAKNYNGIFLPTTSTVPVPSVGEGSSSDTNTNSSDKPSTTTPKTTTTPSTPSTSNAVKDQTNHILQWAEAEQNQIHLRKVVALLKKLRELAEWYNKKGIKKLTLLMQNDASGSERGVRITLYERMGMGRKGTGTGKEGKGGGDKEGDKAEGKEGVEGKEEQGEKGEQGEECGCLPDDF